MNMHRRHPNNRANESTPFLTEPIATKTVGVNRDALWKRIGPLHVLAITIILGALVIIPIHREYVDLHKGVVIALDRLDALTKDIEALKSIKAVREQIHHYDVPADPSRIYTYDDFQEQWNVDPLHMVVFPKEVEAYLDTMDIKNDQYYKENQRYVEQSAKKYGDFIASAPHERRDREIAYVKWSSPIVGYGLFAKRDIQRGEVIGLYSGQVELDLQNTDYVVWLTRHGCT
jgi:hypothetical protein